MNPPTKTCKTCTQEKNLSEFALRSDRPGQRRSVCTPCNNAKQNRLYHATRASPPRAIDTPKACSRCGEIKPLEAYSLDRAARDGHTSACRNCTNAAKRARDAAKPKGPRKMRKDKLPEEGKAERLRGYARNWRARHPEKAEAVRLAWAAKNVDKLKAQWAKRAMDNPERARTLARKRRALKRRSDAVAYHDQDIFERDGWVCGLCDLPVLKLALKESVTHPLHPTIDHKIPISRGGPDAPDNVHAAHSLCNRKRWANPFDTTRARFMARPPPIEAGLWPIDSSSSSSPASV